eukprot:CAMPEP_0119347226 /NCGR_PEP_ID=MMETSP1333-20130426/108413_1 /TAXON_ID=418940 /ORGANISM="Scyphosphaera apsteinii, Strain RCC1455" /LENGTH=204 /DNA_ID=CAMNT_0007359759 /DNA_START=358 /DNA_END=972 /DNA_ORIENTATION=-
MRYGKISMQLRADVIFSSAMLLARCPRRGALLGCVGVEAALLDTRTGRMLTAQQAGRLLAQELNVMSYTELTEFDTLGQSLGGHKALEALFPEYRVCAMLANLAVAPSARRSGLGRHLCLLCEAASAEWGLETIMLQVDDRNKAAGRLYDALGYKLAFRDNEATALRLQPGTATLASTLFLVRNEALLTTEPATLLTMVKQIVD